MSRLVRRSVLLVILLLSLAACAAPSAPFLSAPATPGPTVVPPSPVPTPITLEATRQFDVGGFSVRYPAGWQTREVSNTLAMAPSAADLDRPNPGDGLVILIDSTPLTVVAQQYGRQVITDTAGLFRLSSDGPRQAGYTLGATSAITIDGKSGLAADLSAAGGAGQLIVLFSPPYAVRVLGQAAPAAWEKQRSLFTTIVGSLSFAPPAAEATPVAPDQATQPVLVKSGPSGFVLRLGGNEGPKGGRFVAARGMAIAPDGTLYLAESSQGIWVFAPDGTIKTSFGKGELLDAYDIARGTEGDLFVADYGRNAIARFKPDGTLVQRWGSAGEGPEQFGFSSPQRLASGPDGSVYALDSRLKDDNKTAVSSVIHFNGNDGSFIKRIELPAGSAPNDLAVDAQGNIYLAETFGGVVVKINEKGEVVARLGENVVPGGITAGAIDLDRQGNIYVATWSAGVLKLAPNGALLAKGGAISTPGTIPPPGEFSLPNGVAVGAGGVVWVSDNSGEYSAVTALRLATDPAAQATANALATVGATPIADAALSRQWAMSATASSFYEGYPPDKATGPPDVQGCQDSNNAWASVDPNGLDTLELRYKTPLFATGVNIHQNHQPGFISKVEVQDEGNTWTTVYTGTAKLQSICPAVLNVTFPQTPYRVQGVRVTVDQRSGANWNEIDAVELVGVP